MLDLWIDKHRPGKLEEIAGQNKAINQVLDWLRSWKPGKALFLCGPSGIGKSMIPELVAKERGWFLDQLNANDVRNAAAIKSVITASKQATIFHTRKIILMDELEGLSGRDRGGVKSIADLIKESRFPVFLIAADPYLPKFRPLRNCCDIVKLTRVPVPSIAKRLSEVCRKEGLTAEPDVLKTLARFSGGDLRSAIKDLQIISIGKSEIESKDLEALGYRERGASILNSLRTIFHSRSMKASRQMIDQCDKDPDEIFWWVENNVLQEFKTPEELANVFGLLSSADMIRSRVMKQQNWRFRRIATDLLSGISLFKESHTGFVMYRPPDRLIKLGLTKAKRGARKTIYKKIGKELHCSNKVVKNDHAPYLKIILKKQPEIVQELGLEKEDIKMI